MMTNRRAQALTQRHQNGPGAPAAVPVAEDAWISRLEEMAAFWDRVNSPRPELIALYSIERWLSGARWATPLHTPQYSALRELGDVVQAIYQGVNGHGQ